MKPGDRIRYVDTGLFSDLYDGEVLEVLMVDARADSFAATSGNDLRYSFVLSGPDWEFAGDQQEESFTPNRREYFAAEALGTAYQVWLRSPGGGLGRNEIAQIAVTLADALISKLDEVNT